MAPSNEWGSTISRLQSHFKDTVYFLSLSPRSSWKPDAFDESRFVMTFLTILEVIEICSFRLVLEGKQIPKSSRLEFLEKFLANNFALSDAKDNTSWAVEQSKYSRFSFVEACVCYFLRNFFSPNDNCSKTRKYNFCFI